jgi:hypothetical protein
MRIDVKGGFGFEIKVMEKKSYIDQQKSKLLLTKCKGKDGTAKGNPPPTQRTPTCPNNETAQ